MDKRALRKGQKAVAHLGNRLEKLEVVYLPTDDLIPNEWNPNRQTDHDFELLLSSMESDGFTQPVIALLGLDANGQHVIVDGEHRWRAGVTLGMTEIPTVLVNMTPEQAKVATIRHNRARGSHDIELEAAILKDLEQLGQLDWAQNELLMDDTEVAKMLQDIQAPEALAANEFSAAWLPSDVAPEDAALIRGGDQTAHVSETTDSIGATVARASSLEAIEAQRRRESAIANAKTAQDKALAAQQSDIYRLALIFSGDEGKVVKAALGDRPAETLVKLCRAYVAPAVTVEPPAASQDGVKPPAPTGKRKRATRTV